MRVLVTGGAGFLGSHLCERLLADGHEVTCLDNFSTGRQENIGHLLGNPVFEVLSQDLLTTRGRAVFPEQIYNMACPASPVAYQRDPIGTMKTSVIGAMVALELAYRTGAPVLQASTSEVYGDPSVHPQTESYWGHVNPIGVRSCYDEGKRAAETLFMDYHRVHGVKVRIARIFNTYGPRMQPDDGRVVSTFIRQALDGEPLTVFRDGSQTRSFCYVDDMVDGLVRLMNYPADCVGPMNLGNPEEFQIASLASAVGKLVGNTTYCWRDAPSDDPRQRCPNIAMARSYLKWEPRIQLREGLERTVAWFREQRSKHGISQGQSDKAAQTA